MSAVGVNDVMVQMQGVPAWGLPSWIAFEQPLALLEARSLSEVQAVVREVEAAAAQGRWAVGFLTYEAAPAFDPALCAHAPDDLPLAWFALFDQWRPASLPTDSAPPLALAPSLDAQTYERLIDRIKQLIARGETYQVNLTFPLLGSDRATPKARFSALYRAQQCRYAVYIETPAFALCSASPELFFRRTGNRITCQPMKGTARRGRWRNEDEAIAERLRASAKDRAENVMIVDMMRNDLGRIARCGTVTTSRLFEVERLPTVWQMTSTVEAESDAGLLDLFAALFPCASVTGAPKVQTMRIIRELERGPRGLYTGAIGLVGPGSRAQFNVAIRTLALNRETGIARYGVGSGVVWDSDAAQEYAECLAKALVLKPSDPFELITTMRWEPGIGFTLGHRHVQRLAQAAEYFGYPFDAKRVERCVENAVAHFPPAPQRVRIAVDAAGGVTIDPAPLPPAETNPTRIALAPTHFETHSPHIFHKTTRRESYARARALRPDAEDVILWNDRGEITETTIANLAVRMGGHWITPPVASGLLAGVMREELLARGDWKEGVIPRDDIQPGIEVRLCNALRGVWSARVVA